LIGRTPRTLLAEAGVQSVVFPIAVFADEGGMGQCNLFPAGRRNPGVLRARRVAEVKAPTVIKALPD
jgi:hypothetical protein